MSWLRRKQVVRVIELCHHQWKPVAAVYHRPVGKLTYTGFGDVDDLIYGVTNLTQRCQVPDCGKLKVTRHIGRVNVPGLEARSAS